MQKILTVEDHQDIQQLLADVLSADYELAQALDGTQALRLFNTFAPDLVLLDLMLPNVTGESVLKTIRKTSAVPVIVLTAIQDKPHTVALLQEGANDYVTKPFDIDELLARIAVQLRKPVAQPAVTTIVCGDLCLDEQTHRVTVAGQSLELPKKEFAILALLMRHPHQVFDKASLYETVWGEPFVNADNTLNVHLSNLRTKLNELVPTGHYIVSIWGIGVRLV